MGDELERVNMDEIEAEDAKALPNKEVMSLLDVNANVDLGLDLAAPVDLAVAANLNVAAPIEAAAAANVLSPDGQALAAAQQHGSIDQGISGSADATAPQHADVSQNSNPEVGGGTTADTGAADATTDTAPADGTPAPGDAVPTTAADGTPAAPSDVPTAPADAVPAPGDVVPTPPTGSLPDPGDVVPTPPTDSLPDPGDVTGGVGSFLQGGSLLDANVNIHANANLAAPIDGAVAANGNVAAPIDAAVAANVGSDHGVAEALAPQEVDIHQHLDDVEANATAQQDADVEQQ